MNSSHLLKISVHTIIILSMQILLLLNFSFPIGDRYSLSIYLYPLIIILTPLAVSKSLILIVAFIIGLFIDYFYQSFGVHSASLVFVAFIRPYVLNIIEPRGGYRADNLPTTQYYGFGWFLSYSAILLFVHLLVYFSLDAFSMVYIEKILVNTLLSFVASFLILNMYQIISRQ